MKISQMIPQIIIGEVLSVEPHGQARARPGSICQRAGGTFLDARGAEPLLRASRFEAAAAKLQRSRAASQQHPRFAFLPAQGRGFRRRRVIVASPVAPLIGRRRSSPS